GYGAVSAGFFRAAPLLFRRSGVRIRVRAAPFFPYFLGILLVYSGPPLDSRFDQIYQIYGLEYLIV
ncbi:hypothetical protein CSPX01_13661, partial [Colletotrichum filicis]